MISEWKTFGLLITTVPELLPSSQSIFPSPFSTTTRVLSSFERDGYLDLTPHQSLGLSSALYTFEASFVNIFVWGFFMNSSCDNICCYFLSSVFFVSFNISSFTMSLLCRRENFNKDRNFKSTWIYLYFISQGLQQDSVVNGGGDLDKHANKCLAIIVDWWECVVGMISWLHCCIFKHFPFCFFHFSIQECFNVFVKNNAHQTLPNDLLFELNERRKITRERKRNIYTS